MIPNLQDQFDYIANYFPYAFIYFIIKLWEDGVLVEINQIMNMIKSKFILNIDLSHLLNMNQYNAINQTKIKIQSIFNSIFRHRNFLL